MKTASRDWLFLGLIWGYSLPSVVATLAYRALGAHQVATHNRLDNVNFLGPAGMLLFVWLCLVTQGIASGFAITLTCFRTSHPANKLHGVVAACFGWYLLFRIYHGSN